MTSVHLVEVLLYLAIIVALTPLLGGYMKRVFSGERTVLDPVLRPVERGIYRICGVDASKDQTWIDWTVTIAVRTVPTSTRNMTGLRIMLRGSSITNDRQAAMRTSAGANSRRVRACRRCIFKAWASEGAR